VLVGTRAAVSFCLSGKSFDYDYVPPLKIVNSLRLGFQFL
jgi:hypothetical protein